MKKLSKLKLNDFQEMTDMEMKNVVGGSGASPIGKDICMSDDGHGYTICTRHPAHAEEEGSQNGSGWWCCNCQEALEKCKHLAW